MLLANFAGTMAAAAKTMTFDPKTCQIFLFRAQPGKS
jgi:hypothetical protein